MLNLCIKQPYFMSNSPIGVSFFMVKNLTPPLLSHLWMCAERGTAARPVDASAPMPRLLLLLLLLLLRLRLLRCYWRMSCSLVSAWPVLFVVQA